MPPCPPRIILFLRLRERGGVDALAELGGPLLGACSAVHAHAAHPAHRGRSGHERGHSLRFPRGHDQTALEFALTRAREYTEPVIVHVITQKGRGFTPAEKDVADCFHAVGRIHPETGLPVVPSRFGWTAVFAEEIVELARGDERIVGVTAAMQAPVGLQPLADAFPERVIDVGIAEQHALTASAGMAFAGLHPVVALYATFLNRAFDQLLMDVALHRAGVTVVLDRAGITGTDGPSHNGMWDMALLAHVPGLRLAARRDDPVCRLPQGAPVHGRGA